MSETLGTQTLKNTFLLEGYLANAKFKILPNL